MLYYITSNKSKIATARKHLSPYNIELEPKALDLVEIQSHSLEEIALHKAKQAFGMLQQPLFVNDAGWNISALNGFPGVYMRYMNEWLTPEDYLRLLEGKDRKVVLSEVFCYIDANQVKKFTVEYKGTILTAPQGTIDHSFDRLASFSSDGKSMALRHQEGKSPLPESPVWKRFAEWYKKR